MRAIAILTLLLAFVVAVILPNDIGTNDLPATGAKHLVMKPSSHMVKPVKGGPSACVLLIQLRGETLAASDGQLKSVSKNNFLNLFLADAEESYSSSPAGSDRLSPASCVKTRLSRPSSN